MGRRSNYPSRPNDTYFTIDPRPALILGPYLSREAKHFAEPCFGGGHLVSALEKQGFVCSLASDIRHGKDALTIADFGKAQAIVTNPPHTWALLEPLIVHFRYHRPTWLLLPTTTLINAYFAPHARYVTAIVAVGRVRFIEGTVSAGKDDFVWVRFGARPGRGGVFFNTR